MNDRFGKGKGADMRKGNFQGGIERTGQAGERVWFCRRRQGSVDTNPFAVHHKREEGSIMGQDAIGHRASCARRVSVYC